MKFLFDFKYLEMILMGSKFLFDTKSYIELHHKILCTMDSDFTLEMLFVCKKESFMSMDLDFLFRKSKKEHAENKHSNHHKQSLTHFHDS